MDPRLTFLGRAANRWRVRVELPTGLRARGLSVGLWGEDGRPLAPVVVAPPAGPVVEVELGGPATLPTGAQVRCVIDVEGGESLVTTIGVDRRRGLHAWTNADARLVLPEDAPRGAAMTRDETCRLARAWPWLAPPGEDRRRRQPDRRHPTPEPPPASLDDDLLAMLRDEFDVDVDEMSANVLDALRGRPRG